MTWKYLGILPRRYLVQFQEASLFNNNNNNNKDLYRAHAYPPCWVLKARKQRKTMNTNNLL